LGVRDGPDLVDFGGDYSVTHAFSIPGMARSAGCTGDAQLSSDLGLGFTGNIDIDASGPCRGLSGRAGQVVGSVRNEAITFSVGGLEDPLEVIQCTMVGGSLAFEGSFSTRQVGEVVRVQSLRGTRDVRATCDGVSGETTARWVIRANRR
jgi:hypothetical protein